MCRKTGKYIRGAEYQHQCLEMLLTTRKGERADEPSYGVKMLIDEPITNRMDIISSYTEAIVTWIKGMRLERVSPIIDGEGRITQKIEMINLVDGKRESFKV